MSNIFKIHAKKDILSKTINVKPIHIPNKEEKPSENEPKEDPEKLYHLAEQKLKQTELHIQTMIEKANEQIEQQQDEWEQEKQRQYDEARLAGYDEGYQQGQQEALQSYRHFVEEGKSLVQLAQKEYGNIIDQSKEEVLKIAIHAAEKILHTTIQLDEKTFRSIVLQAIKEVKDVPKVDLYIHPKMYEMILQYRIELDNILAHNGKLVIYPSTEVEQYSCIVETPFGKIDASVETQLHELKTKLTDFLEEANRIESQSSSGVDGTN
ncbi:flagellar assembly protein FliH [Salirhabdus euzebyi]|uniref:Flagellar assembly protein FliH n=1 Tax=Salirhabdus euzebyi TaxID=394506 RepID=A0A841Q3G4_9BACI|nr:flagellar assembly protein FliH [Salirhabdus euzebyi]MBB6452925.1 flagellar assembly protein FliH [Salirhabdus euzebyi]